jgi:hypothetical protein
MVRVSSYRSIPFADRVLHVREDQADASGVEGLIELLQHVGGGGVDVGDGLGRHHEDRGR